MAAARAVLDREDVLTVYMAVPPADAPLVVRGLALLSEEERVRAHRFVFAEDRAAYAVAHALLRCQLASLAGTDPRALEFRANAHGKPELVGPWLGAPCFSLTHTRSHVACALALKPLGVDLERSDRVPDWAILQLLEPNERHYLEGLPEDFRVKAFFRIWTLKEAVLKALGTGLATPLDCFALSLDPPDLHTTPESSFPDVGPWALHSGRIGNDLVYGVALYGFGQNAPTLVITEGCDADLL